MHSFMRGVRESLLLQADAASSAEAASSFWELFQSYSQLRFQDESDPILFQTQGAAQRVSSSSGKGGE